MRPVPFALLLIAGSLTAAGPDPVRTTTLRGETWHVQGIDFRDQRLWVSSVDKAGRKGWLQEFSLQSGERLRSVEAGSGDRIHPGGIALDGDSLWVPVAEYRPSSTSVIERRSLRTLEVESRFEAPDHIGCIAAAPGFLIGGNWDSREFYVWDRTGRLIRKAPNPTPAAYQDIKFIDGALVASGLLPGRAGVIDWLDYPSMKLIRRINFGLTSRGVPYTNEGMALRGSRVLLLPEDSPSRLFEFRLPPPSETGYEMRDIEGWNALVEEGLARPGAPVLAAALDELRAQLHAIARKVPVPALEQLRAVPIWIHRKSDTRGMAFHPSAAWLGAHGFNRHMAGAIEIGSAANFAVWTRDQPWMVLHELAHAYHFRVLGFDNPDVTRTWEAARAGGSYASVLHIRGASKQHYAITNQKEYFAELTEAYFGTNDFYPFVRPELKRHDPAGHDMIRRMWGAAD